MKKSLRLLYAGLMILLMTIWGSAVKAQNAYLDAGLPEPTVTSDKDDYAPGETAHISGSGWALDQQIHVEFKETPDYPDYHIYDIAVNPDGTWQIDYPIELRHLGVSFTVVATGIQTSFIARTVFTDAVRTITYPNTFTATGGGTVCKTSALKLSASWTTAQCVSSATTGPSNINVPVTVKWYSNTTNSPTGGTEVQSTATDAGGSPVEYNVNTSTAGTYYFYATITWSANNCAPGGSQTSPVQTVVVTNPSVGGTVSTSQTICGSGSIANLTLSGQTGSVVRWEKSTASNFNAGNTTNIAITNTFLTASDIGTLAPGTYYFRAVVQNGTCATANSSSATITVQAAHTATIEVTGSNPICTGSTTLIKFTGPSLGTVWYTVNHGDQEMVTLTNGGNFTLTTDALTETSEFELVSVQTSDGACSANASGSVTVTVDPASVGGTATADASNVCSGTGTTIRLGSDKVGNVVKWQQSVTAGVWTDIASTVNVVNYSTGNLTQTTKFRAVVQSGVCPTANSNEVTVTVDPVSVGGTADATADNVCYNTGTTISLTGNTGNIAKWQKSVTTGVWTDIVSTDNPLSTGNLTQTTIFRAVVQSGACDPDESSEVTVTVDPISVGGTADATADNVCYNTGTTISLTGNTGNIVKWQKSVTTGVWTNIVSTDNPLSTGNLTQTTIFRAVVQSGACDPDESSEVTVTVDPASVGGTADATADNVCYNTGTTISLTGNTGNIVKWQKSVTTGVWTDIISTDNPLSTGNLTLTTIFRAVVQSGACDPDESSEVTVTVDPVSVGGTADATADNVCYNTGTTISLTGNTGNIVKWQKSVTTGVWTNIVSTDNPLSTGNLTQTTIFRAVVQSGACDPDESSEVTVTVDPVSVGGTATANATTVCAGTGTTITLGTDIVGNIVKWQKSVTAGVWTDTLSTDNPLSTGNLTQTTTFRAVVQSGVCDPSNSNEVTVTVNQLPEFALPTNTNLGSVQYSDTVYTTIKVTDDGAASSLTLSSKWKLQSAASWTNGLPTGLSLGTPDDGTNYRSWLLSGYANVAPGVYSIELTAGDGSCLNTLTLSLTVYHEDARVEYTGAQLITTGSSSTNDASVQLRATVQDITAVIVDPKYDSYKGDIRNARVRFINIDNNAPMSGWLTPTLINNADIKTGTVSYDSTFSAGTTATDYTIGIVVGYYGNTGPNDTAGYYVRNNSDDDIVLTVSRPLNEFITGGGYIRPTTTNPSAGTKNSDANRKVNFGFNVKYTKNNKSLQGRINVIFRRTEGGILRTFQVKSTSLTSLAVDQTKLIATVVAKGNVLDITNPLLPTTVPGCPGGMTMNFNVIDKGEPGNLDSMSLTLWDNNKLIYSTSWSGAKTLYKGLLGGNIQVRGASYVAPTSSASTLDESTRIDNLAPGTFRVRAYPNPTTHSFTLDVQSGSNEPIELKVFDMTGHMVYYHKGSLKEAHHKFGQMLTNGTYFFEVRQGLKRSTTTILKR